MSTSLELKFLRVISVQTSISTCSVLLESSRNFVNRVERCSSFCAKVEWFLRAHISPTTLSRPSDLDPRFLSSSHHVSLSGDHPIGNFQEGKDSNSSKPLKIPLRIKSSLAPNRR